MKPNMLVVQSPDNELDLIVEKFCESQLETHWVYLVRPEAGFRDDSPAGVRFLANPLDSLPSFPVDIAIAVGGEEIGAKVKEVYHESETMFVEASKLLALPSPADSQRRNILSGVFRKSIARLLPRAV